MGGGSFLGGWLAGDLATRPADRGAEADKLSGELHNERNQLKVERHQADLNHEFSMAAVGALVSWKTTAHRLRASLQARRETEAELLEQLTAEDMRVPLCDPDTFQSRINQNYAEAYTNPNIIEETFENGQIPPAELSDFEDWKKEKGIE